MLSTAEAERLAECLVDQRRRLQNVCFPEDAPTLGLKDLYLIQERAMRLLGDGGDGAAYKVTWLPDALASPPLETGCFAAIPAGRLFENGTVFDSAGHRRLGFECEVAARIGIGADGRASPVATILGLELVEEHHDEVSARAMPALLSAGLFCSAYVVGPEISGWRDVASLHVRVQRAGQELMSSPIGSVLDPDERISAFLAHAEAYGWPLRDGMIVTLGSLHRDIWSTPGAEWEGEIEGVGLVISATR